MRSRVCCWLVLYGFWCTATACPFSEDHPLIGLRQLADQAIVRIQTNGPPGCTGTGTGFFINAAGDVLTAGHLLPEQCTSANTSIQVSLAPDSSAKVPVPIEAYLVARSSLDVALLRLERQFDRKLQFLKIAAMPNDAASWKNRCVLVASHYENQLDTYSTFAEIASTVLIGGSSWALSGEGFNPTRSGSPVILEDGTVAAIFLSRPGDPSDREVVIQSRAYILPIARIPVNELDLSKIAARDGLLRAFPNKFPGTAISSPVNSSFGISITVNGNQTSGDLPIYLLAKDEAGFTRYNSLFEAAAIALMSGSSIVREVVELRHFKAAPGFKFDTSRISITTASLNPRMTPLPTIPCATADAVGCYVLTPEGDSIELRFKLYPGIDGRRAWVDGELHLVQRPK